MITQSYTAVIERNTVWSGHFATEPYESAWAHEAIFFIRALDVMHVPSDANARVQISPDGIHWCDEGTLVPLPQQPEELTFAKLTHFGGWVRLVGHLAQGSEIRIIVALALKE